MSEYHRVSFSCQRGSLRKLTELRCSGEGQSRDAQANGALWAEAEDKLVKGAGVRAVSDTTWRV